MIDTCPVCCKALCDCETVWAVDGTLYCSDECAMQDLRNTHGESAETIFNMSAEEINPRDIGIGGSDDE